jgi:hypothetical protein
MKIEPFANEMLLKVPNQQSERVMVRNHYPSSATARQGEWLPTGGTPTE